LIATRGSALALAQANLMLAACREAFPELGFELKIIKTTGDKLQAASMNEVGKTLPKGLFTKELEVALLAGEADMAVHSLKDLPTDLPDGLKLAATPERADVRDVLIYRAVGSALRGFAAQTQLKDFPAGSTIATSSNRRKMQLLATHPDLNVIEIRGNVPTRLQKVASRGELDATVLALAGLTRLNYKIDARSGKLSGDGVPESLLASILDLNVMLPCVGQGAIGIETRANDERIEKICERLNHPATLQCVTAERAFLHAMGGGCLSPVAAHAVVDREKISMRAVSFRDGPAKRSQGKAAQEQAATLGRELAQNLK